LKMPDLENDGPNRRAGKCKNSQQCLGSKMPDFVANRFVSLNYNYLEQILYLLSFVVK